MAFNSNKPRQDYEANAGQDAFPYLFAIFLDGDIKVYHTPLSTGLTVELQLTIDYTVSISGTDGGIVTLVSPASLGDFIVLERSLSLDRIIEYQTSGDLLASTLNLDQDYQTYLVADQNQLLDSAIKAPPGVPGFDGTLPAPEPEAYIIWSADGKSLENDTTAPSWVAAAEASATAAATSETNSASSANDSQLKAWEAEAESLTADSYATEAEDVFVKIYTSDGDGTFTATDTTEYSAVHWAAKAATFNPALYALLTGATFAGQAKGITPVSAEDLTRKDYSDGNDIGVGQTWQDMSGSRAAGVTYTNNTGKPIQVAISVIGTAVTSNTLSVDGVVVSDISINTTLRSSHSGAIVPNGSTYIITSVTVSVDVWAELRA